MDQPPLRIVQLSDLHLFSDPGKALLGVKTQESFQAVLDLLRQQVDAIDLIILSGDLSQDGSQASYERLAACMTPLNKPIYYVPGNHDAVNIMTQVYPCSTFSNDRHLVFKEWQMILLNSQKPGAVEGELDATQFAYLEKCLQSHPEHHAIILFHHQPVPVGCEWLDKLGLVNAKAFWERVADYPNVHTVLFGHVHQAFSKTVGKIPCYSAPSTCIQFKRQQAHFGLEKLPPGFRWVHLYDEGRLETGVTRVADYVGIFDPDAKGY